MKRKHKPPRPSTESVILAAVIISYLAGMTIYIHQMQNEPRQTDFLTVTAKRH